VRYDPKHKAQTRLRIVESAARAIRSSGPERLGVSDVMASVGLTHGGFYAHFPSKDALVTEAVDAMFGDARRRAGLDAAMVDDPAEARAAFRTYLASYLSPQHRDHAERGCPLPALAADMARGAGDAQQRFAKGIADMTARIASVLDRLGVADANVQAGAVVAQMAGAVGLARAVGKGAQSDAILHDVFTTLCSRLDL
jgi:TetR/AcrR family transcriptional regulator, transcriptional repressor for nem operon